jgi:hypothetical protein
MTKTQKILLGILIVQIGLAAATFLTTRSLAGASDAKPFLGMKAADVTGLAIEAGEAKPGEKADRVELAKKDGGWVVASGGDFPAKADKVDELVKNLAEMTVREPISTQASGHAALGVADAEFGRKVTIEAGGAEKTFFVGSGDGPGVHLRFANEPAVYQSRGVSAWSVSASARAYVDSKYVDVDKDKLSAVTVVNAQGTLTFKKVGDSWTLAELPAGEALDADKVKLFVGKAAKVNLEAPVGKEILPALGLGAGAKVTLVGTVEDKPKIVSYLVGARAGESSYYAKADDSDYVVTVSKYSAEQLLEKVALDFAKPKPKEDADSDSEPQP